MYYKEKKEQISRAVQFKHIVFVFLFSVLLILPGWQAVKAQDREVTILYTNDFHSAFNPIPAYWIKGSPKLGGAAYLTTFIRQTRKRDSRNSTVFLFDSGDMFTGMLSNLTHGRALMNMMTSIGYDAMDIGNHEFDYTSKNLKKQIYLVSFPILGANIYYKGTNYRYSRPYTIIERNGIRIGVIGIIGKDALSVISTTDVADLDFRNPIPELRKDVAKLRPYVDLIVVLAHEGFPGPMQTDAEAQPGVQRKFPEDIKVASAVPGIDVFIAGHSHIGIETPYVVKKTGTIIVQTYGYGTRLGYLKLLLGPNGIISYKGKLLKVWSDSLRPDPAVSSLLKNYKKKYASFIGEVVGHLKMRLVREYNAESPLGDFVTDVMRKVSGVDIAFENAGGLRADIPEGAVTKGDVLNALPFKDLLVLSNMTGAQISAVLEQGLTLEAGMIQVSGIRAHYDMSRPSGHRLIDVQIDGRPINMKAMYRVAETSFIGEGGDHYKTFTKVAETPYISKKWWLYDVVNDYFRKHGKIKFPTMGRLIPMKSAWQSEK